MTMNKKETYRQLAEQVRSLVDGVDNGVGALANVAALLKEQLPYYFWVGSYISSPVTSHVRRGPTPRLSFPSSVATRW